MTWIQNDGDLAKPQIAEKLQSLAIKSRQVAVPTNTDHVDDQNTLVQWNELEVDELHEWPNCPIGRKSWPVTLCDFLLWI